MTTESRPSIHEVLEEIEIQKRRAGDRGDNWHLDKTMSVGHIITTLVALGAFIGFAVTQDRRVTTLEQHDLQNQKDHVNRDSDIRERLGEMKVEQKEQRAILEELRLRRK